MCKSNVVIVMIYYLISNLPCDLTIKPFLSAFPGRDEFGSSEKIALQLFLAGLVPFPLFAKGEGGFFAFFPPGGGIRGSPSPLFPFELPPSRIFRRGRKIFIAPPLRHPTFQARISSVAKQAF